MATKLSILNTLYPQTNTNFIRYNKEFWIWKRRDHNKSKEISRQLKPIRNSYRTASNFQGTRVLKITWLVLTSWKYICEHFMYRQLILLIVIPINIVLLHYAEIHEWLGVTLWTNNMKTQFLSFLWIFHASKLIG